MELNLQKYPLLRVVLMFAAGISLAWSITGSPAMPLLALLITALLITASFLHLRLKSYSLRWLTGLVIHLIFFIAGFWAARIAMPATTTGHFSRFGHADAYLVRLTEPLSERRTSYRAIAEVEGVIDSNGVAPASGRILVYLRKTSGKALPGYGDHIAIQREPEEVPPPLNPGQFDFRKHLARKGVLHQVFLTDEQWRNVGYYSGNPLFYMAYSARDYLVDVMRNNGLKGDEFAVASAILLGYDEMLSHELRKGYTGAGAMHVLCVSGLHVGIIYLLFSVLLNFLNRFRRGKLFRGGLLLLIIWFYAFITGLSPSVMRSALMISFLIFGEMAQRRGQALNTLAAAALIILIIDPASLFSIGFQLSFAAVAGILLFQKPLARLITFRNKVATYFWEATTVALAAQLSTTPLVLYYFHQFPFYFWLSNLFLTPLSFLIILTGMFMLLSSPLPFLPSLLGWISSGLIYAMNAMILWVESLPMAVLKHLYINWFEAVTLMLSALLIAFWIRKQINKVLIPVLLLFFLTASSISLRYIRNLRQDGLLVYALSGRTALSFVHGNRHVLIADSAVMQDAGLREFNMLKFWNARGISQPLMTDLKASFQNEFMIKEGPYIAFSGKLLRLCDVSESMPYADADIYLMHGKQTRRRFNLEPPGRKGLILLDASLSRRVARQVSDFAKDNAWQYYELGSQGAFFDGAWK